VETATLIRGLAVCAWEGQAIARAKKKNRIETGLDFISILSLL